MKRTISILVWGLLLGFGTQGAGAQGITIDTNDVKSIFTLWKRGGCQLAF